MFTLSAHLLLRTSAGASDGDHNRGATAARIIFLLRDGVQEMRTTLVSDHTRSTSMLSVLYAGQRCAR